MAWRHKDQPGPSVPPGPPPTVRVLRGDAELAAAAERAAEGQRRLQARLEARAARDAWTAQRKQAGVPGAGPAPRAGHPDPGHPGHVGHPDHAVASNTPAA